MVSHLLEHDEHGLLPSNVPHFWWHRTSASSKQKDASLGHSGTTPICLGLSGKAEVGTWWLETTAH